jgi:hypothetical protein
MEWKQYQQRRPDERQLTNWFYGRETNLAVICGQISGGL